MWRLTPGLPTMSRSACFIIRHPTHVPRTDICPCLSLLAATLISHEIDLKRHYIRRVKHPLMSRFDLAGQVCPKHVRWLSSTSRQHSRPLELPRELFLHRMTSADVFWPVMLWEYLKHGYASRTCTAENVSSWFQPRWQSRNSSPIWKF